MTSFSPRLPINLILEKNKDINSQFKHELPQGNLKLQKKHNNCYGSLYDMYFKPDSLCFSCVKGVYTFLTKR